MRIRSAVASDAPAIARVHVRAWRESYRGLVPDATLDALDEAERRARWEDLFSRGTMTFVAEAGDDVVGFASVGAAREWAGPESGELYALYVLERAKRRGVGSALLAAGARRLLAEGHASMMLWVLARNASARAFYEASGGRVAGARVDDDGLDKVAYAWPDLRPLAARQMS